MEGLVAGLDIGTSSIKFLLFDKQRVVYSDRIDHLRGIADAGEIDPRQLIEKVISIVRKASEKNKGFAIKAIGLSVFFPSLIVLDKQGSPLTKIMTWMDNKGAEFVEQFKKNRGKSSIVEKKTGCIPHASYPLWKILWLKKYMPEVFKQAWKFLSLPDYITYKFTGKFIISNAFASTTSLFNINSLQWDRDILKMIGITKKQLAECRDIFYAEPFQWGVCQRMGVNKGTKLVIGAGDGHLSNMGSGCLSGNVICSSIGTSAALRIIDEDRQHDKLIWKNYLCENKYVYGIAINAGLGTLTWAYENIFNQNSYDMFNDIDKINLVKSNGLLFLPFLAGERGPGYNHKLSAVLFGMKLESTPRDIYQAIVEGILFNLYHCYEILIKHRGKPYWIKATGGYVNSKKMLQMQSDIFNLKVKIPKVKEASALGAAMVASVAIGKLSSLSELKILSEEVYVPNKIKHEEYMKKYRAYRKLYALFIKVYKKGSFVSSMVND